MLKDVIARISDQLIVLRFIFLITKRKLLNSYWLKQIPFFLCLLFVIEGKVILKWLVFRSLVTVKETTMVLFSTLARLVSRELKMDLSKNWEKWIITQIMKQTKTFWARLFSITDPWTNFRYSKSVIKWWSFSQAIVRLQLRETNF